MGRMAMAANMAEIRPISTGWRLPQLDRIALGVVDAGEAPDAGIIPLGPGDDLDARLTQPGEEILEAVDAQVEHHLPVGREIVAVGWKGREDRRSGLLLPHAIVAAADATMIAIPDPERVRVARPEEQTANPRHRH